MHSKIFLLLCLVMIQIHSVDDWDKRHADFKARQEAARKQKEVRKQEEEVRKQELRRRMEAKREQVRNENCVLM